MAFSSFCMVFTIVSNVLGSAFLGFVWVVFLGGVVFVPSRHVSQEVLCVPNPACAMFRPQALRFAFVMGFVLVIGPRLVEVNRRVFMGVSFIDKAALFAGVIGDPTECLRVGAMRFVRFLGGLFSSDDQTTWNYRIFLQQCLTEYSVILRNIPYIIN